MFWLFLPSKTPIMQYNICYWYFFLSQFNQWTKYLVCPKIWKPKHCLLMFASLTAFWRLSPTATQLTADLTLVGNGGSMFHPLSYYYTKTHSGLVETVANNRRRVVFFFWSTVSNSCKIVNTLPSDIFKSSPISCNFNLRLAKRICRVFWVFFRTTAKFETPFVSLPPRFKSPYPLQTPVSDGTESE